MKCYHTSRCILLTLCVLQMISTGERQLFDFLGRMWLPILCNFFNFIFVIFGFFGAYQYKPKYIIVYLAWMFIWLTYNVFIICFYLNVGILSNRADWLNFGTGSASWWEVNGIGCEPLYPTNLTEVDVLKPLRPEVVKGCVLNYEYVETIHAAFQCCFALPGIAVAIYLIKVFSGHDESFEVIGGYGANYGIIEPGCNHLSPILHAHCCGCRRPIPHSYEMPLLHGCATHRFEANHYVVPTRCTCCYELHPAPNWQSNSASLGRISDIMTPYKYRISIYDEQLQFYCYSPRKGCVLFY